MICTHFMKIRLVEAELSHADGGTDRHDEANSHFLQFCKLSKKRNVHLLTFHEGRGGGSDIAPLFLSPQC